ncbi:MFS transporter [Mesorhizobium sp. M0771]|uniref:MFS transporter n=1 Tax=Mesorhizobium sp. M0771 TaxID=2956997 RepID=UPI0004255B2F
MTAELSAGATDCADVSARALLLLPLTVACGVFMTSLDQNVVVTALPGISDSLGRPPRQLGLLITVYVASLIISMPLGGWAADRFGLRNVYCFACWCSPRHRRCAACPTTSGRWSAPARCKASAAP